MKAARTAAFQNRLTAGRQLAALLLIAVVLSLAACSRPHEHREQLIAFGTLVDIIIYGADEDRIAQASSRMTTRLNELHRKWHAWEPGTLTEINRQLAAGETAILDDESRQVLGLAAELSATSGGLFNPAIGKLVALWGFHSNDAPVGPPPPDAAIATLLAANPQMSDLIFNDNRLSSTNPAVQLDLGAFAKGHAVDVAIDIVKALGIEHAIVNAGGDLRAIGRHGDRPWRVGIRNPGGPGILAAIETTGDESVFTSGDYERYFEHGGRRYHHIIDPRSGYPASGTTSVTVIHRNAALADAAATALFVAGPEHWQETARRMGVDHVMLVDPGNNIHMTPAMTGRVAFESGYDPVVIVSEP